MKLLIDECLAREVAERLSTAGHDAVRMSTFFAVQAKMSSTLQSRRGLTRQAAVCVVNPTRLSVGSQLDLQSFSYVVNHDVCDLGRFAEEARFHTDGDIGIENQVGRDGFSSQEIRACCGSDGNHDRYSRPSVDDGDRERELTERATNLGSFALGKVREATSE